MYKGKGPYAIFAGNDVTVSLAKVSDDKKYLWQHNKIELTQQEETKLEEWITFFKRKYTKVGRLKE